jgi:hypothetical protein
MITWQKFIEERSEKEEERNEKVPSVAHSDHDKEKGEPKEHQKKVADAHKEMISFFTKRKEGAAKIANDAKEKGTPASQLTQWHFSAKSKPYTEVLTSLKANKPVSFYKQKCLESLKAISIERDSERQIQEKIGVLEVWAETYAKVR